MKFLSIRKATSGVCIAIMLLGIVTPAFAQDEGVLKLSNADVMRYYPDGRVEAQGHIQATYGEYTVTSEEFRRDPESNIGVFQGTVTLTTSKNKVEGEALELDLKTRKWKFSNASTRIEPSELQGKANGPVFIHSTSLSGDEKDLVVEQGTFTTCDLEHPHYYFSAKEIDIHPDSRIVARKVSIVGLDKRLFTLNSLVIPTRGLGRNFLPQVGSSAEEGMFVKTSYAYAATDKQQGFLKLDLMQKRGIGAGAEHSYNLGASSGQLSLYYLADRENGGNNITGRLQHHQQLGSLNLNLTSDYITNSYLYYPSTTTQHWQMDLSHTGTKGNTALTFRGNAVSGTGDYETISSSLRHTQQFDSKTSGQFSVDTRSYKASTMMASDREMDSVLELRRRDDKFDLSLVASRRIDLDGDSYTGDDFYSSLDRLPELAFETDTFRSGIRLLGLPSRFAVSAGRYHEEPSGMSSDRLLLQWDMPGQTIDIGSRSDLNLTAGFRQALYGRDEAQYVLKLGGVFNTRHNDYMKTRLTYNYQRPEGYSPFLFDYTGKYNYLRAVTDYQDSERLRWSLSAGYDFNREKYHWQDLALRLTAHPNSSHAYSLSTGYDLNRGQWRNLIGRFQVSLPQRIGLDVGTRYDLEKGKVDLLRGRFDVHVGPKWRIEGITSWSGLTKQWDYRAFRLTRDLHCWQASIVYNDETGFRTDRGLSLELRIKAFPTPDRFGIGQYGQSVDTSMGEYY